MGINESVTGSACWGAPRKNLIGLQNSQTCSGMSFHAVLTQMVREVCRLLIGQQGEGEGGVSWGREQNRKPGEMRA